MFGRTNTKDQTDVPALTRKLLMCAAANYYSAAAAVDGPSVQTARFNGKSDTGEVVDGLLFLGPASAEVADLLDNLDGVTRAYMDHVAFWLQLEETLSAARG